MGKLRKCVRGISVKRSLIISVVGIILFAAFALILLPSMIKPGGEKPFIAIDGYEVTEQEFQIFLDDSRALAAAYFHANYGVEPDTGFWERDFDGQTPLQYARQMALNAIISARIEQILMAERKIEPYEGFEQLKEEKDAENAKRTEKLKDGEIFYGLTSYDIRQYYKYKRSLRQVALQDSQYKLTTVSDAELMAIYDETRDEYTPDPIIQVRLKHTDGTKEERYIESQNISKEDYDSQDFWEMLKYTSVGTTVSGIFLGENVTAEVLSLKMPESVGFDDVKSSLKRTYAAQELQKIINDRAKKAKILIDESRYGVTTFN